MGSIFFKTGKDKFNTIQNSNLWQMEALDIDLKKRSLSEFLPNKKAFIFVNVASE
jgi:hypothetical protein